MTTADNNVQRKLEYKVTTRGSKMDSEDNRCEEIVKVIVEDGQRRQVNGAVTEVKFCAKPSLPASTKKRGPETSLVGPKGKIRRMDRIVKLQCGNALKDLMKHPCGWIFNEPVDPVKWKVPDYFSVIKQPMDLGTVNNKLEGNLYSSVDEFAADVRLIFSNAMMYNPPANDMHKLAKLFNKEWKSMEAKLKGERTTAANYDGQDSQQSTKKSCVDDKRVGSVNRGSNKLMLMEGRQNVQMSLEEKLKLKSEVMELLSGRMTEKLCAVFKKLGLGGLQVKRLQSYIDSADDEILWKLRKAVKISFDAKAGKVNPMKTVKAGRQFSGRNELKDPSSGRSLDTKAKYSSTFDIQSGPDSDGPEVVVNDSPHLSTHSATAGEGCTTTVDIQLSPKKALRAAMLKNRFPRTIYKAAHQVEKFDPTIMQQERVRLERKQLEEEARIEREIKASEAAMRKKAQAELKMKREKEREAARMALEKMERTVEFNDSQEICREFEMLLCCSPDAVRNPLEQLGSHRKKDDYYDYVEEDAILLDLEEGEILS